MDSDAKYAAIVVAVLLALILITSGGDDTPSDYPSDMDACIYTGVGGYDC